MVVYLSTISSEIIDDVDIYAGGYGAEFGLDSQNVLDIHSRDRLDKRWRGKFNLNFLYSEGILEGRRLARKDTLMLPHDEAI